MAKLLNISINISKLDKTRIIKGEKGDYLPLTISVNDEKDNYGNDVSAWQAQEKEERDANQPKNYVGNGRIIWSGSSNNNSQKATQAANNMNNDYDPFS